MEARYINQVFASGVPTVVPVGGRFFRVLGNVNPFVLEVGFGGQYAAKLEDAVTGDWGRCREGQDAFTSLRITAGGAETIKILITDGEIGRDSANLDVSDRAARLLGVADVSDKAARLLGIVYGTLGQVAQQLLNGVNALVVACKGTLGTLAQLAVGGVNAAQFTDAGIVYGASFATVTPLGAGGTNNPVTPAANVNGLMVWRAELQTGAAVANQVGFVAKASAPGNAADGVPIVGCAHVAGTNGASKLEGPVFIPAGLGLYFFAAAAETCCYRRVLYTVL